MEFNSRYQSKMPDEAGYVTYDQEENEVWRLLYERQLMTLANRACKEHMLGLERLGLSADAIPQLPEVNARLYNLTGWGVEPVTALISHQKFFQLLASRKFPAATFIRKKEELDYIKEPDIFHELFGHCPLLTQLEFADFVQLFAEKVLQMDEADWPLMQRLFWFTVEFGLIQTSEGIRAYGGGILSSIGETVYSVESDVPQRTLFNLLNVFRTPYRIDVMQPVYFVIESYQQLYDMMNTNLESLLKKARQLGEFPPLFKVAAGDPNVHIMAC